MTEEVQALAEATPAPEQVATAAPETEVQAPEVEAESQPEQTQEERKFTQAELEAAIGKRLAREQRKWEREQAARAKPQAPVAEIQLDPDAQYDAPTVLQKARELVEAEKRQAEQAQILNAYHEREEAAREKFDDFEQVAYNPNVPITDWMAQSIQASEIGPEVAYYLGSNVKEAQRISQLSPLLQAKEIGKIEAKLVSNPPVKKTTSAPPPVSPVTARASGAPSYDTTDPRSVKTMTTSEWIEAERQRQIRKLEAQRR